MVGRPTRSARFLRKLAAPELRESPGVAYAAAGGLLLALVVWGPTPAFLQLAWIVLVAALLALGVTVLRRQTAVEFPGVQRGDASESSANAGRRRGRANPRPVRPPQRRRFRQFRRVVRPSTTSSGWWPSTIPVSCLTRSSLPPRHE